MAIWFCFAYVFVLGIGILGKEIENETDICLYLGRR